MFAIKRPRKVCLAGRGGRPVEWSRGHYVTRIGKQYDCTTLPLPNPLQTDIRNTMFDRLYRRSLPPASADIQYVTYNMEKSVAVTLNPLYEAADADRVMAQQESNRALEACKRWVRGYGASGHKVTPSMERINIEPSAHREPISSSETEYNGPSGLAVTFKVGRN